ncbi:hypothetical protein BVRB_4g085360 [Beta vulgaris subsp. vulgaris]|nr:hypothetical protein BVRB_4g085360 [Beta vulgaris subsp. vulgaris]
MMSSGMLLIIRQKMVIIGLWWSHLLALYGAYLADGSEYSGPYGEDVSLIKLKDFHRRRLQVLAGASPGILAFETIPNRLETQGGHGMKYH